MHGYKEPSFQDRVAIAQSAKNKAFEQLRNRPPIDEAEQARRAASQAAKDEARRLKRIAAEEAKQAAAQAKQEQARLAAEAALAAQPRVLSEAELKAARDQRYAARKARKS